MAKRLSAKDIDSLMREYRSEKRRLNFQLDTIRAAMRELRERKDGMEKDEAAPKTRGRASTKTKARPRKRGRRKKRTISGGGYQLSNWDNMVMDTIKQQDRLLTKSEIIEVAKVWAKKNEPKMKAADVEAKITRVLQKLAGKRNVLGTHRTGLQRGYHYGLIDWFFATSGKLKRQFYGKLVIDKT